MAGDAGLNAPCGEHAGFGWPTWRRLLEDRQGALAAVRGGAGQYRLVITSAGRQLYERDHLLPDPALAIATQAAVRASHLGLIRRRPGREREPSEQVLSQK